MNRLPFEQLRMEQGVIQELTEQDRDSNLLFRVRCKKCHFARLMRSIHCLMRMIHLSFMGIASNL